MIYAIYVVENLSEIRDIKIKEILEEDYYPDLDSQAYFIGGAAPPLPIFINWYNNTNYINKWQNKEDAEQFLKNLLETAEENYNTKKDPFYTIRNTKGDWKKFLFKVVDISCLI